MDSRRLLVTRPLKITTYVTVLRLTVQQLSCYRYHLCGQSAMLSDEKKLDCWLHS